MRVITGAARGVRLQAPPTRVTRPTLNMMKEAMFAALGEAAAAEKVLDLYAGSGQLGIEALSRGASQADFVDSGRIARRTIGRNLETTGFRSSGSIWGQRLPRALLVLAKQGRGPYDLVLVDPPYAASEIDSVLAKLGTGELLTKNARVVVEYTKRRELAECYGELVQTGGRRHGDNVYAIFQRKMPGQGTEKCSSFH